MHVAWNLGISFQHLQALYQSHRWNYTIRQNSFHSCHSGHSSGGMQVLVTQLRLLTLSSQYVVAIASLAMILVSWVLTPLQNGIFVVEKKSISRSAPMHRAASLLSMRQQAVALNSSLLNTVYASVWLNQTMPIFTTSTYALAPFDAAEADNNHALDTLLEGTTTKYFAKLDCQPAAKIELGSQQAQLSFDDGKGCRAANIIDINDSEDSQAFASYFIGYASDAHVDYSLEEAGCGIEALHSFLGIRKRTNNDSRLSTPSLPAAGDMTALFCQPSNYQQTVQANIFGHK